MATARPRFGTQGWLQAKILRLIPPGATGRQIHADLQGMLANPPVVLDLARDWHVDPFDLRTVLLRVCDLVAGLPELIHPERLA